ncbi:MAG: signal peptide peptidase SppA [Bryobacterales bacterium]|nr:signal peptide peptidase SppA [Bryobacterales bacterium]
MAKFFLGLLAGLLLAVLCAVLLVVAAVRVGETPPVVASRSVLVLDLDGDIVERPPATLPLPFLEERMPLTVTSLWRSLKEAATDSRIKAVVFMPGRVGAGWGKLQELRGSLEGLAKSGKPVFAFLRTASTREYYLATAAGRVYMPPEDMLDVKGLRAELTFFRGTLDKLGAQVEIVHAGKYKDFGDTFTRTSMSPETREVLDSILDELFAHTVDTIAAGRKKTPAEIRATLDDGPFLSRQALEKGLVDGLLYEDQVFSEVEKAAGGGRLSRVRVRDYVRARAAGPDSKGKEKVAFIVGEGAITGSLPGGAYAETGLSAPAFIKLLRQVAEDGSIRGAIVRVDSPGGDSFASDEIWREMNRLSGRKPLIISMSDEAASGGYYVSMTGDPVVAYPGTLTGSIGVVYGKASLRGLYQKLGISKEILTRGRFADIDSDYTPLDEAARRKLRDGVDDNYRVFVEKVAAARKRKFAEIEPLAQGRVWLGSQARKIGLVDELGGLDRAVELIRERARIPAGAPVTLVVYPPQRSLIERLMSRTVQASAPGLLKDILRRWPAQLLAPGGYLRLVPYQLQVQ